MFQVVTKSNESFTEGKWFDVPGYSDIDEDKRPKIKVARSENQNYIKTMDRLRQPVKKQLNRDTLPADKTIALGNEAMARALFVGMKNFADLDGAPLEDTFENRFKIVKFNPEVRELVETFSKQFDEADEAEEAGKSPDTSIGG